LLLILPVFIVVAIAVKLDSPGPVFFIQPRVGSKRVTRNGETHWEITTFPFYKFRSMTNKADEGMHKAFIEAFVNGEQSGGMTGEEFKMKNDPRVTRVGRLIRRTSLDELPQLFNILRGEMSWVGPRPVPTYEFEMYPDEGRARMAAMPGLTGLWQVEARATVPFEEQVRLDLEYIESQSLWTDFVILLKTPAAVISGRGAG
jgi:lipopolysaccharide/colanic/teichoic acid biosynthesis glycosyltransferase